MDVEQLKTLLPELEAFIGLFDDLVDREPSRQHMRTYVSGQLGPLERKTIAAIALEAGKPPRTLQEFMGLHVWDDAGVRVRHQQLVAARHPSEEAIAVVDETAYVKKGRKTVGVQRQYCGATGKVDNCMVSVNLGYVTKDIHTLVASDLFLPKSWLDDSERCREAGLPPNRRFRTKPKIALDELDEVMANGLRLKYLAADELYGRSAAFRNGVAARRLLYVVEIPCDTTGWTKLPVPRWPSTVRRGPGRPPTRPQFPRPVPVQKLAERSKAKWKMYHIKETEKGPKVWQARSLRFFPWVDGKPGPESRLIIARSVLADETKYFLSNAPSNTPVARLLSIGFCRSEIEELFERSKGQIGLDHFQVYDYKPLMRHMTLSMLSLTFLIEQTQRLRGEKSGVDASPGSPGHRGPVEHPDLPGRAGSPDRKSSSQDRVLAGRQSTGQTLAPQEDNQEAPSARDFPVQDHKLL